MNVLWSNFLESNLHNFNLCLIAIVMLNVQMWNSALCLQSLCAHSCSEYGQTLSTITALWESRQTFCFLFSRGPFFYFWLPQEPSLKLNRWDICLKCQDFEESEGKGQKSPPKCLFLLLKRLIPLSCPKCTVRNRNREGFEETVEGEIIIAEALLFSTFTA